MGHGSATRSRTAIWIVALAAAIVAGGCGDSVPTTGPASPVVATPGVSSAPSDVPQSSAPPTPAPTPVDASAAFSATVTDPSFSAEVAIKGRTTLGKAAYTVAGTMTIDGQDSHLVLATTAGKTTSKVETLVVDGIRYSMSKPAGMWFGTAGLGAGDLAGSLRGTAPGVTDTGVETMNGQQLHHLVITPPGTLPAALGVNRKTYTDVTLAMDAWVEEDGTPVVVELGATWTQPVKGKPVAGAKNLSLTFSPLPSGTTLSAPETVWQWNTSARFKYRMAYPDDWTFKKGTAKYADAYYGFDNNAVFASRGKNAGLSLRELSGGLKRYLPQITKIKSPRITSNKSARLGPLPARRIEYTYKVGKVRYYSIMYLAVKGSAYYAVEYETLRKTTAADRALAAQFARSFTPR